MMRDLKLVVVVLAGIMVAGVSVQAQDQQPPPPNDKPAVQSAMPKAKVTGTPKQAIPTQVTSNELPDEQQATKEQIEELLDVMRVEDQLDDMLDILPAIQKQQHALNKYYEAQIATLTAAQKAQVDLLNKKYQEKADDIYSVADTMADLTRIYQNHINSIDVESLITFYSSESAQHLLEAQPLILKEYLPLITAQIAKKADDLQAQQKKEMDALMASFKTGKK